jgi:hypothetical protein
MREIAFAGCGGRFMRLEAGLGRIARTHDSPVQNRRECEPQVRACVDTSAKVDTLARRGFQSMDDCELASPRRSGTWTCRSRSARAWALPAGRQRDGRRHPGEHRPLAQKAGGRRPQECIAVIQQPAIACWPTLHCGAWPDRPPAQTDPPSPLRGFGGQATTVAGMRGPVAG